MIIIRDNQRAYLRTWEYNAARILTELAKIVVNNGGRVKPMHSAIISNRSLDDAIYEYTEKIERLTEAANRSQDQNPYKNNAIAEYTKTLEQYKSINNEPITVTHTSYITFILDDTIYYYQVDCNPFFPFHYTKTPVNNGKYSKDASMTEDNKEWLYDCFFMFGCSEADIKEGANLIYNMLVNAKNTPIIRDGRKHRVRNTYNDGYHYEMIYAPERIETVNF